MLSKMPSALRRHGTTSPRQTPTRWSGRPLAEASRQDVIRLAAARRAPGFLHQAQAGGDGGCGGECAPLTPTPPPRTELVHGDLPRPHGQRHPQ